MTTPSARIALYYDPDGYVEQTGPNRVAGGPAGLMGRQVAGREFLDAFFTHGQWESLAAVVRSRARAEPLVKFCQSHVSSRTKQRRLRIVEEPEFFAKSAGPDSPADLLHVPCPPDSHFAWARYALAPTAFAISGVTHTLASAGATSALCDLVSAPFEPYDSLICTSRAVVDTVRAVTGSFADYLRDRFGGNPALRVRLELIPLGVNPEKFRPPTAAERADRREDVGVADDEVMVLCVGRLAHHAKAHPFPIFHAAHEAARRTKQKVHLVFAGWAAVPAVADEYRAAARYFAPAARVSFLDGQDAAVRAAVWHAADVFISLPDNVQETFGLVAIEAMASGLPIVGSDWDGYRDLIADGETGYLVPTRMVRGASAEATARLLFAGVSYDRFLAECAQAAAVDAGAAADALTRLVGDAELRRRMGAAGRKRAVAMFGWDHAIRAYERLWAEQCAELVRCRGTAAPRVGPARYPPPEQSFASYPSAWLGESDRLRATAGALAQLAPLLSIPLTNLAADRRCNDRALLAELLRTATEPRSVGELATHLERTGLAPGIARATVAWLLKYGLLAIEKSPAE